MAIKFFFVWFFSAQHIIFNIYRYAAFGLSGVVVMFIFVICLLVRRKRRPLSDKKMKRKISAPDEEGGSDKPRDEYVSEPGANIELHPRPPEEQSRTSLVDVTIPDKNTDPVFDYVTLDGEKEEKRGESSYEVPVDQQVSEPTSYMNLHRGSQEEQLHAYQSLKVGDPDPESCGRRLSGKKMQTSREDSLQEDDQDSGYCDRSFNEENVESEEDTLPDEDPSAGYYNRSSNRKKIGKPGKDSLQAKDPAPGYYNRSIHRKKIEKPVPAYYNRSVNRDKIQEPVPGEDVYEIADSQA